MHVPYNSPRHPLDVVITEVKLNHVMLMTPVTFSEPGLEQGQGADSTDGRSKIFPEKWGQQRLILDQTGGKWI